MLCSSLGQLYIASLLGFKYPCLTSEIGALFLKGCYSPLELCSLQKTMNILFKNASIISTTIDLGDDVLHIITQMTDCSNATPRVSLPLSAVPCHLGWEFFLVESKAFSHLQIKLKKQRPIGETIPDFPSSVICSNLLGSKPHQQTSLMVEWVRIHLPVQGTWIGSRVQENSTRLRVAKPMRHNY